MDDEQISFVEDLTPEPQHKPRTAQVREIVLGLVLLLGVLTWAGWQTWQQSSNESHYQAAEQAVARHDWDAAYGNFSAARGYKDSQDRATQTAGRIAERDRTYKSLISHTDAKEWVGALNSAQDLKQIEPGFKQAVAVEAKAKAEVYRAALSGTIALRIEADPPGLYYRTGDHWLYLLGSDLYSKVLTTCPGGRAVYDTPGRNWAPPPQGRPTPMPPGREPGSPQLKGRLLTLFTMQGSKASYAPISLSAEGNFTYACSENAIWGMMRKTQYADTVIDMAMSRGSGFDFVYSAFGSGVTSGLNLPLQGVVADIDQAGDHLLLAGLGAPQGSRSTTSLYLTGPDGGNSRVLYTTIGDFQSAQFSPSGRYVLLITRTPTGTGKQIHAAVLFDLLSQDPPHELAQVVRPAASQPTYFPFPLSATFLQYGRMRDRLVLAQLVAEGTLIQAFDPANHTELSAAFLQARDPYATGVFEHPDGSGTLLVQESSIDSWRNGSITNTMTLQYMEFDGISPQGNVRLSDNTFLVNVAASKGKVLFGVTRFTRESNGSGQYSLMSAPIASANSTELTATAVYTTSLTQPYLYQPEMMPTVGDGVLSYVSGGNLHVRSYDDLSDAVLERGISTIYDIRDTTYSRWLR